MYLNKKNISFLILSGLSILVTACGGSGGGDTVVTDPTQAITLNSSGEGGAGTFSALLLSDTGVGGTPSNTTGIVLIHGRGGNPDAKVVRQLRKDLYDRGYMTLSIQAAFPVAGTSFQNYIDDVSASPTNNTFTETYARVREAINELQSRGATDIVLIGFSMGSRMVTAHAARGHIDELPIIGLVGVGMYATSGVDPLDIALTIDEISIPVLDIYGDGDPNAVNTAASRVSSYGGMIGDYTQVMLDCAAGLTVSDCHKLSGLKGSSDSPLEVEVSNWISNL